MQSTARKIGNSVGTIIPSVLSKKLGIKAGFLLNIEETKDGLLITTIKKPKYKLTDLLAKCDPTAPMPQELTDWDNSPPVGNEKW